jgi:hypothetical protein
MGSKDSYNRSVDLTRSLHSGPLEALLATHLLSAQALAGAVAGTRFTSFAAGSASGQVGPWGRNLRLTIADNDNGGELSLTIRVEGKDQFGQDISEVIGPLTGDVGANPTLDGTKIFSVVTAVEVVAISGLEASDTFSLGTANKVGIPAMFAADRSDILTAWLINAAGTTGAPKAIDATNFDSTNFALNADFFGGTVTDGDSVSILFRHNRATPDNVNFPQR